MTEPILHHDPKSPFVEKIRLVLGYKKLAWQSVHIPMVMPKPDLQALTGGYRKTPVLQVGAAFQDDHGIALGSRVSISSNDFGPESSEGELVAATRMHYTLRRADERAGTVHVHFPRIGYVLRAAEPA